MSCFQQSSRPEEEFQLLGEHTRGTRRGHEQLALQTDQQYLVQQSLPGKHCKLGAERFQPSSARSSPAHPIFLSFSFLTSGLEMMIAPEGDQQQAGG